MKRAPRLRAAIAIVALVSAAVAPLAYVNVTVGALTLSVARHLSIAWAFVAVLAAIHGERRTALALVASCAALWIPWWLASVPAHVAALDRAPCARVLVVNAFERNVESTAHIAASLEAARADVVLLVEPRPGLVSELAATATVVLHHDAEAKFDLAAFVDDRARVRDVRLHRFEGTTSVVGEIVLACEQDVSVFFVHIPAPTVSRQQAARWHMKDALAAIVRERAHVVVAGDFNAVPPSPVLRDLRRGAALTRVTDGATWPVDWGPAGVPIDHVLVRGVDVRVARHRVAGSDHAGWVFDVSPRRRGS